VRPGSPTLGRSVTVEASSDEPVLFWAPASFARGFAALSDVAEIEYFCTAQFNPACETGIRWDDPSIAMAWPVERPLLSPRDAGAGTLADWLMRPESATFAYRVPA
jgi:dTDP-4-dehydrorhamnose 3,5-epimerase